MSDVSSHRGRREMPRSLVWPLFLALAACSESSGGGTPLVLPGATDGAVGTGTDATTGPGASPGADAGSGADAGTGPSGSTGTDASTGADAASCTDGSGGVPGTARQGAGAPLYTGPSSTFIEQPTGESVVTIVDASGTIAGVQSAIDDARAANPGRVIVIHLQSAATYTVSGASLVLGSDTALVGTGATIQAASAAVTVPLISISSGSAKVSVAGGTYDGNGADISGIYGSAVSRVNIDDVLVRNCIKDGILLVGHGSTTYDSEFAVTRSDCSGSSAHAGISVQQCTMAYVGDNNAHGNLAGISLDCAWANVANNVCENNTTGIDLAGGNDNVVANNSCNDNATGIHVVGSNNMIVSNATSGNTTVGIASAGTGNNYLYNASGISGCNASNFGPGGTSDNIIAYGVDLDGSGQNYFYPPLIDNQHEKPIASGKGRTDVTITSTSIDDVQTQYNGARGAHPNDVIVLHLKGTFSVGSSPLSLSSDTSVLLDGTIQIDSATTATAAIAIGASQRISISGGTIDGGGLNGHFGVNVQGGSMIQVDKMTIQNLGDNSSHHSGSDAIHFFGSVTPNMVTRCTVEKSGARGIWSQTKGKALYAENVISDTRAGIDCDSSTAGAVMMFNTATSNTYGLWYEQGAQHNVAIGNVSANNVRNELDVGNLDHTTATEYNSYVCNKASAGIGIITAGVSSDGGTGTATSHNFLFNNVLVNASINANEVGAENYYSQNTQNGGTLATSGAGTFFNPTVP
jgi:parallel beta-helix repeat protein